jgi:hypothetical protein
MRWAWSRPLRENRFEAVPAFLLIASVHLEKLSPAHHSVQGSPELIFESYRFPPSP